MTYGVDYFITGACGMVGSHLVERLSRQGMSFHGTSHNPQAGILTAYANHYSDCDVRDAQAVRTLLFSHKPKVILHLAAQSYPTVSWTHPQDTMDINGNGTINVFEAIKHIRQQDSQYDPMVVVACSSAQYGAFMTEDRVPINEETPMLPLHPYGVSKVAQDMLAYQYFYCDKIRVIRARIFNTTGPRKRNDVISDWASRVAAIEKGQGTTLRVGNMKARRAIMDVSDLIEALLLLSERGTPGEAYNICHDQVISLQDVLDTFKTLASVAITEEVDPSLLRASDEAIIYGDNSKLKAHTGWKPMVDLTNTVRAVLEHERTKLA